MLKMVGEHSTTVCVVLLLLILIPNTLYHLQRHNDPRTRTSSSSKQPQQQQHHNKSNKVAHTTEITPEMIERVLKANYSSVEDGEVLLHIEAQRLENERDKMAVVNAVFGGYDAGPPPVSEELAKNPKLGFFFFCDEGYEYHVPHPWVKVTTPHHNLDREVDLHTKNSLSVLEPGSSHAYNMMAKYYDHVGWRLPELRPYRYVLYAGGGWDFSVATNELYEKVLKIMKNPSKTNKKYNVTMIVPQHARWTQTITSEAQLASGQPRYAKDRVMEQARHYVMDWECPEYPGQVVWLGMMIYDAYAVKMRRLLYDLYQECQVWTLEDQVALPFLAWRHDLRDSIHKILNGICVELLNFPNPPCRKGHITAHYGQ